MISPCFFESPDGMVWMEPKFEGSESLGNRKQLKFFLVILILNAQNFRLGGKVFDLLTWRGKTKTPARLSYASSG
jgi:hypothetical protein